MHPPCVLTVAGSDSGGGAGIQADLKTIMMQGCYGLSVVTALTAQNTRAVTAIEAPTPGFVAEQLRAVLADFPIRAAKTGMLFSAPIIAAVADGLTQKDFPLVVDPVCVAQSGARLLLPEAMALPPDHAGHCGFGLYQSHVRYSELTLYRPVWTEATEYYQ